MLTLVGKSAPLSWARFKAVVAWNSWIRKHGCAVLRFANKAIRERDQLKIERDAWKQAAININDALGDAVSDNATSEKD